MDKNRELEIFDRLEKIESRLNALEEKINKLTREPSGDFRPVQSESNSEEPIIDG